QPEEDDQDPRDHQRPPARWTVNCSHTGPLQYRPLAFWPPAAETTLAATLARHWQSQTASARAPAEQCGTLTIRSRSPDGAVGGINERDPPICRPCSLNL